MPNQFKEAAAGNIDKFAAPIFTFEQFIEMISVIQKEDTTKINKLEENYEEYKAAFYDDFVQDSYNHCSEILKSDTNINVKNITFKEVYTMDKGKDAKIHKIDAIYNSQKIALIEVIQYNGKFYIGQIRKK